MILSNHISIEFIVCLFFFISILKEWAKEVGEEVGMEVAKPKKRLLEGVAPIGEEELRDILGGGEVEGFVVGLEVLVEHFNVGEESWDWVGDWASEEG